MTDEVAPVVQALVEAAVHATGGTDGWILVRRDEVLEVVAAAGPAAAAAVGARIPAGVGTAGFVLESDQPIAIAPDADDERASTGMAAVIGRRPASVLCIPCDSDSGAVGVLEIVDKLGSEKFSFDDVELATMLAGIAGVALAALPSARAGVPLPNELAGELRRLADSDPGRYATVATLLAALLASG